MGFLKPSKPEYVMIPPQFMKLRSQHLKHWYSNTLSHGLSKWLNGKLCYQNFVDNKMFFSMQLQRNGNELYLNLSSASILGKTKAFLIQNELNRIETKVIPTQGLQIW